MALWSLHAIVGIYPDGSHSIPLAKYADRRRAEAALVVIDLLAEPALSVDTI